MRMTWLVVGMLAVTVVVALAFRPTTDLDLSGMRPYFRGEGFYHALRYTEAIEAYQQAMEEGLQEPEAERALLRMAVSHHKAGNLDQAKRGYQHVMKEYPRSDQANIAQSELERIQLGLSVE